MEEQNFENQGQNQNQAVAPIKKSSMAKKIYTLILLGVIIIFASYFAYSNYVIKPEVTTAPKASVFDDKFFGVFLDTGDIYFGKLSNKESSFVTVDDAFYLRVTENTEKDKNGKPLGAPQLNLIKLGTEMHKPTGKIEIQRTHIVSIQELSADSEVIKLMVANK
ncbi:MAG: hypothetical protein AAB628_02705 [Patescibacteria group bacterium]